MSSHVFILKEYHEVQSNQREGVGELEKQNKSFFVVVVEHLEHDYREYYNELNDYK